MQKLKDRAFKHAVAGVSMLLLAGVASADDSNTAGHEGGEHVSLVQLMHDLGIPQDDYCSTLPDQIARLEATRFADEPNLGDFILSLRGIPELGEPVNNRYTDEEIIEAFERFNNFHDASERWDDISSLVNDPLDARLSESRRNLASCNSLGLPRP